MTHSPSEPSTPSTTIPSLFSEALSLLSKNVVIVYPVFLYIVMHSLLLNPNTTPDFSHWAIWVVMIGLVAIGLIFQAGWSGMILEAITEWQHRKPTRETDVPVFQNPFRRLKAFIPAMGEHGPAFLLGGMIWYVLSGVISWAGIKYSGFLALHAASLEQPNMTTDELKTLIENTPVNIELLLIACLVIMVMYLLTMFWQPHLLINQCNPFKAFYLSMVTVKHHFGHSLVFLLYFILSNVIIVFLSALSMVFNFFGSILLILNVVFFGLLLFLFIYRTHQAPNNAEQTA